LKGFSLNFDENMEHVKYHGCIIDEEL